MAANLTSLSVEFNVCSYLSSALFGLKECGDNFYVAKLTRFTSMCRLMTDWNLDAPPAHAAFKGRANSTCTQKRARA